MFEFIKQNKKIVTVIASVVGVVIVYKVVKKEVTKIIENKKMIEGDVDAVHRQYGNQ